MLLRQIYNTYGKCICRHSNAISYLELLPQHLEGRCQKERKPSSVYFQNGEKIQGRYLKDWSQKEQRNFILKKKKKKLVRVNFP